VVESGQTKDNQQTRQYWLEHPASDDMTGVGSPRLGRQRF
jgi:hypothetical protein